MEILECISSLELSLRLVELEDYLESEECIDEDKKEILSEIEQITNILKGK